MNWRTKSGLEIPITSMTDGHLINTIRMLRRTATRKRLGIAYAMECYAEDAPDGAAYCAEQGASQLIEMDDEEFLQSLKVYRALISEAKHRGVNP